jgi:hypothetical protein
MHKYFAAQGPISMQDGTNPQKMWGCGAVAPRQHTTSTFPDELFETKLNAKYINLIKA